MLCPACSAPLEADAKYCSRCGTAVVSETPKPPADPLRAALETALASQYKIVRILGRGGMGAVYLARELALDRLVAIKVLPPGGGEAPENRERFRREARTAARLTHPNIVPLYTMGEVGGMLYFVMGYVRGEPLAGRMRREGKLEVEDTRRILGEIADALDYAHRQGIIHRDIKPDNILIEDESGRAMLTDFGVARARASDQTLTHAGTILGTPKYMSPEQVAGKSDIDGRSDLYSLGVMGYAMLSGRLPFEGDSSKDILLQHMTQEAPRLKSVAPTIPEAMAAAIQRCLAKEPTARWPDGSALRKAIALDASEPEDIPEEYEVHEGRVFWGVATTAIMTYGALLLWLREWLPWLVRTALIPILLSVLVLTLTAPVINRWLAHRKGWDWSEVRRVMYYPPRWWWPWYPKGYRRPGDVWSRLPREIRRIRAAVTLVILSYAFLFLFERKAEAIGLALLVGSVLWSGIEIILFHGKLRKRGLPRQEADKYLNCMFKGNANTRFWKKPRFAALLAPPETVRPVDSMDRPMSPDEYLSAILHIGRQLTGPLREAGSQAVAAARHLLTSIAAIDEEIANLSRGLDPEEPARLEQRLSAFGAESETEGEPQRQMRRLVANELDLVRGITSQIDAAGARREECIRMLANLWTRLKNAASEDLGSIRALCAEIEQQAGTTTTGRWNQNTSG